MKKIIFFITLLILAVSWVYPLEVCPNNMQVALLLKIIPFVRNFENLSAGGIDIGIYNAPEVYRYMESASKKVNYKVNLIQLSDVEPKLDNLHIIYISRGNSASLIEKLNTQAKKNKVLTVSGDPQAALDSNLTLSFYVVDEKPKILINMKSAKEEGINFSSRVLSLSDVRNIEKSTGEKE